MSCNQDCNQGRSCDALGVCQQRRPACQGCTAQPLRLAPGVLDGYRLPLLGSAAQRRALRRVLKQAALWLGVLALSALSAGYLVGRLS